MVEVYSQPNSTGQHVIFDIICGVSQRSTWAGLGPKPVAARSAVSSQFSFMRLGFGRVLSLLFPGRPRSWSYCFLKAWGGSVLVITTFSGQSQNYFFRIEPVVDFILLKSAWPKFSDPVRTQPVWKSFARFGPIFFLKKCIYFKSLLVYN